MNTVSKNLNNKLNLLKEARIELSIIEESNTIARKTRDKELKNFVEENIYKIRDKISNLEKECSII